MRDKEKDDFVKVVHVWHHLVCEIKGDIDSMNFGLAKLKANVAYDFTEKVAKVYDPEGKFTNMAFLEAMDLLRKTENEVAK